MDDANATIAIYCSDRQNKDVGSKQNDERCAEKSHSSSQQRLKSLEAAEAESLLQLFSFLLWIWVGGHPCRRQWTFEGSRTLGYQIQIINGTFMDLLMVKVATKVVMEEEI